MLWNHGLGGHTLTERTQTILGIHLILLDHPQIRNSRFHTLDMTLDQNCLDSQHLTNRCQTQVLVKLGEDPNDPWNTFEHICGCTNLNIVCRSPISITVCMPVLILGMPSKLLSFPSLLHQKLLRTFAVNMWLKQTCGCVKSLNSFLTEHSDRNVTLKKTQKDEVRSDFSNRKIVWPVAHPFRRLYGCSSCLL